MSFEHPIYLLFMFAAIVPAGLLWFSMQRRNERLRAFAESAFVGKLILGESNALRWIKGGILSLVCILVAIAAAGPQIAGGTETVKMRGIDIVVAIDVSNSMLADDLKPNRLEKAKLALTDLVASLEGDRLGAIVFAGEPYTCLPLCDDHAAAEMIINSISTESVTYQGTALAIAIDHAVTAFNNSEDGRGKAIIIISDGEDHEDDAIRAAEMAAEKGIIVCAIGIGTPDGTTIPVPDENGNITEKRDGNGQVVVTKLDDGLLKDIVAAGNGTYVRATNSDLGLTTIMGQLRGLSATTKDSQQVTTYTPVFHYVVIGIVFLLIVELFLAEGTRQRTKKLQAK
jgi:Ca-activated chloride channel family protein